jgi:hypothetical protein
MQKCLNAEMYYVSTLVLTHLLIFALNTFTKSKTMRFLFLVLFLGLGAWAIDPNVAIFSQKMELPKGNTKAETAMIVAKSFLEKPYTAHTLEQSPEKLVCNLKEFDCFTFVESILAITASKHGRKVYSEYVNNLQQMRYRKGQINDYGSRLHYFLEWKLQNENRGLFVDVTAQLGTHRSSYSGLQDEAVFEQVLKVETTLSQASWHKIPKEKVAAVEAQLQEGDIVGITSNIAGLDFNHEGFVVKKDNRAYLLHASSDAKKIVISADPLTTYLQKIKKHDGIVVLRLK